MSMHRALPTFVALAVAVGHLAAPASAAPTPVTVRVLSQDAKFVSDGTGGASVTLRDAASGKVLAAGLVQGGTGNTDKIMQSSGRSPQRASADAAAFNTSVDIDRPTLVELEVSGPLGRPSSAVTIKSQRWMIPGEAVTAGDGWSVELPGLAITPVATLTEGRLHITAKVEPMCGCPITPGGLWDSANYRVTASLWQAGQALGQSDMTFAVSPGGYQGDIAVAGNGAVTLIIYARNTVTGASGMAQLPLKQR